MYLMLITRMIKLMFLVTKCTNFCLVIFLHLKIETVSSKVKKVHDEKYIIIYH